MPGSRQLDHACEIVSRHGRRRRRRALLARWNRTFCVFVWWLCVHNRSHDFESRAAIFGRAAPRQRTNIAGPCGVLPPDSDRRRGRGATIAARRREQAPRRILPTPCREHPVTLPLARAHVRPYVSRSSSRGAPPTPGTPRGRREAATGGVSSNVASTRRRFRRAVTGSRGEPGK